jgi:hypothetical protein
MTSTTGLEFDDFQGVSDGRGRPSCGAEHRECPDEQRPTGLRIVIRSPATKHVCVALQKIPGVGVIWAHDCHRLPTKDARGFAAGQDGGAEFTEPLYLPGLRALRWFIDLNV